MKILLAVLMLVVGACSSTPQTPTQTCEDPVIKGSKESLTLTNRALNGVEVGEPISCDGKPDVDIPLQAEGWRQIVMGRGDINGYAGCSPDDAIAGPADGCPKIQFDLFAETLAARIMARGATTGGAGLGVCGDINADYAGWHASVAVLDWAHADIAIEEAAQLMNELQIGNIFYISVTHPVCGVALEG